MSRPVEIPARLKAGPFTVAEAVRAGLAWHVLDGPRFRRLFHGVYASVELEPTLLLRCRAVLLLAPDSAVFSHRTAALLRGLPIADDQRVHLTVPPRLRGPQVKGIAVHRRILTGAEVHSVEPLDGGGERWRITAPARTFADLASELGLVDLVITGDAMVRAGLATSRDLVEAIRPRVKGAASARRAAHLVRARVDSPMETRLRLLIVLAGLPCPEPGRDVHGPRGDRIATVDLLYPEQRIVLEYDGDLHRTKASKWRRDQILRRTLHDLGYDVHAFNADDISRTPLETLRRIHTALRRRGHPEVPERLVVPGREVGVVSVLGKGRTSRLSGDV